MRSVGWVPARGWTRRRRSLLAESQGFEPWSPCGLPVFKSNANEKTFIKQQLKTLYRHFANSLQKCFPAHQQGQQRKRTARKHEIDESFYIYLQRNSTVWLARFKIGGKWISRTTKQRDKAKAVTAAIKAECEIKHEHGITIQTKAFKQVAELAITRMHEAPEGTLGRTSFAGYELIFRRYHIPFFDRTHITSIDHAKLAEFGRWREQQLGRVPSQSTLKNHNVALQRVFDEAVIRRWMTPGQIPTVLGPLITACWGDFSGLQSWGVLWVQHKQKRPQVSGRYLQGPNFADAPVGADHLNSSYT